ncbi:MAG: DNA (cytosine-5-)-methyltransferase [bacterium (Candidatus Ratteibacteria) CG_4_10_14_3_um_filter_41_18]|uniref:DNA (Cytosine-5-)-methyltransferase n=4 Tax=Candidatus Ratteibacteria TaxID=2979319 RepID=A0A2M7EAF0_9BACT|nr:MAG: DNA (cytosine-5-)-methyltransferase [bacterium (Candidatus Ratteibacteria) CG01_land_8_20_14_3_00_40_19]PIW32782.1 MAG: DNA (cytosine-5-)-methyltransferase [bacterium (Candidatus Ratteibacteria) CG15_BIG_FIL_POST_REV_8_21_14_020_41_12]PIX77417.1 MAG: DNA (cytosine-5-)-methyltransferase [bacterium (Candidatus Ratteibacteria) CG_4_10_14_3_um_filter_41_18]PJA61217.1 MAG: DNA (cytosine-5-)-methyltransferase [bacterium (Candidatus Ratteibacteria) CG_4_9_14_3_um_filter_41_21]HCG76798.1 DNA (c
MKKYKEELKNKAKRLRKKLTETEKYLWNYLRNKQIDRFKFRRQQPIGKYIVDFINFEKKLVIEVDGGQHSIYKKKDVIRDKYLKKEGYKVLRFWDNEVLNNIEGVLEMIINNLSPSPKSSPLKGEDKENS